MPLLVNFESSFKLELMYIFLILSIRSSLTHLCGFQLLVQLPQLIEITYFVSTTRINPLNLKQDRLQDIRTSSDRLVIISKGFLKLPNLHMLIKQKSLSLTRNLAFRTKLPSVLNKVNLLYLLYSISQSCCLLHLIEQNCSLKNFPRTLILMTLVSLYPFSLLELI